MLIALVLILNLFFAQQPAHADRPKVNKNPDYIEVNNTLKNLTQVQQQEMQTQGAVSEATQGQIEQLELQKYAIESGMNWGQCSNETGKTLAIYGGQPKDEEEDDDEVGLYENQLYFLATGQTTEDEWDCDGFYLPKNITATNNLQTEELAGPIAVKILDGTQLVIKTNPDTGVVEFDAPLTKSFHSGEVNWFIPNLSQSIIDTRVANAPT